MNNTLHSPKKIIKIPVADTQMQAIQRVKRAFDELGSVLYIDLTDASFLLSRDFFIVMARRFHKDEIFLIVASEVHLHMAQSAGLQVQLSGTFAEFEREYQKKNILAHNMTIWEYFLYELRRGLSYIGFFLKKPFLFKKREKIIHFHRTSPNMFLIVVWLIVSVTLLLFIFHFAVTKTYVKIKPQIIISSVSNNIIYALDGSRTDIIKPKNVITQKRLRLPVEHEMKFAIDTVDPNSAMNALGTITIINELSTEQVLKPQTRFVAESGELFRAQDRVVIPPAQTINGITEYGRVDVQVQADILDVSGKIMGNRGNIKRNTTLTIPWLKFNRDKVYATAKEDFVWWADPRLHVVSDAEVQRFSAILHEKLMSLARTKLQDHLDQVKKDSWEDYALLMGDGVSFSWETLQILSWQKVWDIADEITLKWTVYVDAITYDRKKTLEFLTEIFHENILRWTEKELAIHPDTLRVSNVVSQTEDRSQIKVTMEMNVSTVFDFESKSNELALYYKKIIAGLSKKEATSKLINDGKFKDVEISFSPFWIKTVSSNIDNIEFVLQK
jgi:hypothetical protein